MRINIKPNIEVFELPSVIHLPEGSSLRDAISIIAPQLIDATGKYKDDPDIWKICLNDQPVYSLIKQLDTQMSEGDTIGIELILMVGG